MTQEEIQALLPFLANDTLTGDERTEVQAAVAADPELQTELKALQAIRTTMQTEEAFSPGEMGLARLMRDVEDAPIAANAPTAPMKRPVLWQIAAAVLLAVVLGQGLMMRQSSDPAGYGLASGEAATLTVGFTANTTEAQMRALLIQAGVKIVSGPSELGLYQLATLDGTSEEAAIAVLAPSDLVETLEAADD